MKIDITEHDISYSIESNIPQQKTTYDCGVYICEYAEQLTRDSPLNVDENTKDTRKKIRMEIKSLKLRK